MTDSQASSRACNLLLSCWLRLWLPLLVINLEGSRLELDVGLGFSVSNSISRGQGVFAARLSSESITRQDAQSRTVTQLNGTS